ncbi:MAG TPA: hypothetical protein VN285_00365 [Candidatus Deferrimicrobium sp.]|nr:hypothetical protein [Candidatus Deferrimicrobium sp.]
MNLFSIKDEKHIERRIRDLMRTGNRLSASQLSIGLNVRPSIISKILKRII